MKVTHSSTSNYCSITNQVTVEEGRRRFSRIQPCATKSRNRRRELLCGQSESAGELRSFIFLDSNVSSTGENGAASDRGTNASRFRVSGGQALGTEILIDGASTRRSQNGTFFSEVAPGPNAFQEFTISTSSFSAEYGNSSGGVINLIQKFGSNDFHGEVYDFVRTNITQVVL